MAPKGYFIVRDLAVLLYKPCSVCAEVFYAQVPACANSGLHAQPFCERVAFSRLTWCENTSQRLLWTRRASQDLSNKPFHVRNGRVVDELQLAAVDRLLPPPVCHYLSIADHMIYPYP